MYLVTEKYLDDGRVIVSAVTTTSRNYTPFLKRPRYDAYQTIVETYAEVEAIIKACKAA